MKIGIMTFWWSQDNYGQLLQCYSLQKYLRDLGHEAFLIRYNESANTPFYKKIVKGITHPKKAIVKIVDSLFKNKKNTISPELLKKNEERQFSYFMEKYIRVSEKIYTQYVELKNDYPKADVYIVGSDQIWNFSSPNKNSMHAYFLDFGTEKTKRISYSASFGVDSLSTDVQKYIKPLLQKFSFVSVRENSGKKICENINISSEVVCDPTLLLSENQWLEITDNIKTPNRKYIFAYILSNTCEVSVRKLKQWADRNGLGIVYVSGNVAWCNTDLDDTNIEKSYLTINQWIDCLANAEYIVTNSFHCCVFSLIFSKKIGVIPLTSNLKNTNDRINSLFDNLKVTKTEIVNNDFSVLVKLSEQKINTEFIDQSKKLLQSILK